MNEDKVIEMFDRIYNGIREESLWRPLPKDFERCVKYADELHKELHKNDWIEHFLER